MITQNDKANLRLPRGISLRYNRTTGIASSIQIAFTYKGILCRESVGYTPTYQGVKSANNLLGEIKNRIANQTFFYADYFPKSKKLELFGAAKSNATVQNYLERYIENAQKRGLAKSTITGYTKCYNGLKPLWSIPVAELDVLQVINFIKNSDVSYKTLANRVSLLHSSLNTAVIEKIIRVNPLAGLRLKEHILKESKINTRGQHQDVTPFNPQEISKIISNASGTTKAIICLRTETGMRCSEWVALKKQDVCLVTCEITIYEAIVEGQTKSTKTKHGFRTIPISRELADMLEFEMDLHDSEYVFVNRRGKPWIADSFRKHIWSKLLPKAGVKYRYPYQLRHTFATRMISQGMNLWKLSKLMGHASPQQLYQHYGNYIEAYDKKLKRESMMR